MSPAADILLVVPPGSSHYLVPPLGLGYLAGALREQGFTAELLDCQLERLDLTHATAEILSRGVTTVGVQAFSADLPAVLELARRLRARAPSLVLVLGGAHPSGVGPAVLDDSAPWTYAFRGEAEVGLPRLLAGLAQGAREIDGVPGLMQRRGGAVHSAPAECIQELDSLAPPAWDLMDPRRYSQVPQGVFFQQSPIAPIVTSRGCPHRCAFCAGHTLSGRRLRLRSMDAIFAEVDELVGRFGVRELHILDDAFNASRGRVLEFCAGINRVAPGLSFTFPNGLRLDGLDAEVLDALRGAGCHAITLGIESGSQRILDAMGKGITIAQIQTQVDAVHDSGIPCAAFFILGFPGETDEDRQSTLDLACSLPLRAAHFSSFLPLPGTAITEQLAAEGQLDKQAWEGLHYARTPFAPAGCTPADLKAWQRRAYRRFYGRPRILLEMLKTVRSPTHLQYIVKRVFDYAIR